MCLWAVRACCVSVCWKGGACRLCLCALSSSQTRAALTIGVSLTAYFTVWVCHAQLTLFLSVPVGGRELQGAGHCAPPHPGDQGTDRGRVEEQTETAQKLPRLRPAVECLFGHTREPSWPPVSSGMARMGSRRRLFKLPGAGVVHAPWHQLDPRLRVGPRLATPDTGSLRY